MGKEINSVNGETMSELSEETRSNTEYLRNFATTVVEMWECEWTKLKQNPEVKFFFNSRIVI